MLMIRIFSLFALVFCSSHLLSQDKKDLDNIFKNADLRKQMDLVKLEDFSEKLKKAKKLDNENLGLLKQKIDIKIYIRLENESIGRLKTKDVDSTLLKISDSKFKSFLEMISKMVPGVETEEKVRSYLEENGINADLIKKAIILNNKLKRVKSLEDIDKITDRKILEAEKWTEDDIYTPSFDVQSTFEERIDAIIKKNDPKNDIGLSLTDKKSLNEFNKSNAITSDLLKFLKDLK